MFEYKCCYCGGELEQKQIDEINRLKANSKWLRAHMACSQCWNKYGFGKVVKRRATTKRTMPRAEQAE